MGFYRRRQSYIPDIGALRALKGVFDDCSAAERRALIPELHLIGALRQEIIATGPQLVISFINIMNIRVLLAVHGLGIPVIVSERDDPYRDLLPDGMNQLRRRVYRNARYLVAQTGEAADYFTADVGSRRRAIPNPVLLPQCSSKNGNSRMRSTRVLAAMGRLVQDKGFNLLLRSFSHVAASHPTWSLHIWGEGPQRQLLERTVQVLNLNGRVWMPGFTRRPFEALRDADLFALSSLVEGFPNALCEAMACGLPVISFDCSSGIREIVRHEIDGLLVPAADVAGMASALDRLMSSEEDRTRLAGRAVEVTERFAPDKMMARWEELALQSAQG
jgi:glycosyltransferase involved in cell wall biosynthesis